MMAKQLRKTKSKLLEENLALTNRVDELTNTVNKLYRELGRLGKKKKEALTDDGQPDPCPICDSARQVRLQIGELQVIIRTIFDKHPKCPKCSLFFGDSHLAYPIGEACNWCDRDKRKLAEAG